MRVSEISKIYAIRFFQGIAESSTFVGTHYVLGSYVLNASSDIGGYPHLSFVHSWYKPGELGKRSGIFTSSGLVGTLYVELSDGPCTLQY